MSPKFFLIFAIALTFGACPNNNSNTSSTSATPTGGTPISLSQTIPDSRTLPEKPAPTQLVPCPLGTFDLIQQTIAPSSPNVTGTSSVGVVGPTTELADGEMKITVNIPDGTTYAGKVKIMGPTCQAGPEIPFTVTFGLTYRAVVETEHNQPFCCIFRSRADYSSFNLGVAGSNALGAPVEKALQVKIKDGILRNIDSQTANTTNQRTRANASLPTGADPRCSWSELPADGIVRH
jgi:hypothetical protein